MSGASRRQFFTQLFGAVAPTVAVAVYPGVTLGLLERFFWKPAKKFFLPAKGKVIEVGTRSETSCHTWNGLRWVSDHEVCDLLTIDELFKAAYCKRMGSMIPTFTRFDWAES